MKSEVQYGSTNKMKPIARSIIISGSAAIAIVGIYFLSMVKDGACNHHHGCTVAPWPMKTHKVIIELLLGLADTIISIALIVIVISMIYQLFVWAEWTE